MDEPDSAPSKFVRRQLPWIVAGVALLVYIVTLNPWVNPSSLPVVSKITGWDWSPQIGAPLYYVVTLPVRLLPITIQPIAANLLSAFLAALTLFNLARSVVLLPHDRTREQRQRERSDYSLLSTRSAWIPPVFAALGCGLQLTFWEHATLGTYEMLNLCMFAYLIRCLLEFRVGMNDSWLYRFALLYGFAVTNSWSFLGYFPLFAIAVVWIKGVETFRTQFLSRFFTLGFAGLILYLLLPTVIWMADHSIGGYWDLFKIQLTNQKNALVGHPKSTVIILSLTSILPVLVMGIRWPSSFGDTSILGSMLTNLMFRLTHLAFLAACLWVAFDPAFSPRSVNSSLTFLSFYYLGALAVGYFSGYCLLVFGRPPASRHRHPSGGFRPIERLIHGLVIAAFLATPLGLAHQNYPLQRVNNGGLFPKFLGFLTRNLPRKPAVLVSDDSNLIRAVQAGLAKQKEEIDHFFIDTSALSLVPYRSRIRHQLLSRWPSLFTADNTPNPVTIVTMRAVLRRLADHEEIYYLHSSFGYYFEALYPSPRGLIERMKPYPDSTIYPPEPDARVTQANEVFWRAVSASFKEFVGRAADRVETGLVLGRWLSRELNVWGIRLQRAGKLEEAGEAFQEASAWNPENLSAEINVRYNHKLASHSDEEVKLTEEQNKMIQQRYRSLQIFLQINGPIDEPNFLFRLAQEFFQGGNYRQAATGFHRVVQLENQNIQAHLWLANSLLLTGFPQEVLDRLTEIEQSGLSRSLTTDHRIEIKRLRALSFYQKGSKAREGGQTNVAQADFSQAKSILLKAEKDFPKAETLYETLAHTYLSLQEYQKALHQLNLQLALSPNDIRVLQNIGIAYMRLEDYDAAIEPLSRVLRQAPDNIFARMNRAISYLQSKHWDEAKADYEKVRDAVPNAHRVYYGLGEIALRQGDTALARQYYERYLKYAPKSTDEYREIADRLSKLQKKR